MTGLRKLSNHLADIHGIDGSERKKFLLSAANYSMHLYYIIIFVYITYWTQIHCGPLHLKTSLNKYL